VLAAESAFDAFGSDPDAALPTPEMAWDFLNTSVFKFLRLRTPVTIGSRFGEGRVCWIGGWTRQRLAYLVLVGALTSGLQSHAARSCSVQSLWQ
jgi:hypothetical protein